MKLHLPKKPPGQTFPNHEPHRQATLLKADFYGSAEESAARRQAIMARVHEKRVLVKAALRARHEAVRLRA